MNWQNRPDFNDPCAKTKTRAHNTFGGKTVEILYGAKDAEGNPTEPKETMDGIGRWTGIEVNGKYLMFTWQHSAEEGGAVEYGTEYKEDALNVMEEGILKKQALCREAEAVLKEIDSEDAEAKIAAIKEAWNALPNWETPKEEEYAKRFELVAGRYDSRAETVKANRALKEAVLAKAEEIKEATNFNEARKILKGLRGELSDIGSAGASTDDDLWGRFNAIENDLRRRQREYFDNLDANRAAARAKKEEVIENAKKLVENPSNWKAAGEQLNNLFNDWKAAGSAGRDIDDELWQLFNGIRQDFFARRQAFFDERNAQWAKSIEAKNALIEEAAAITAEKNYSKEKTERMKALDREWKTAGYSGKNDNDRLWDEFCKAKEEFWSAKKAIADKRFQDQIDSRLAKVEELNKQIEDLEYRMTIVPKPAMKKDLETSVYLKKGEIESVEKEIEDLKTKLS